MLSNKYNPISYLSLQAQLPRDLPTPSDHGQPQAEVEGQILVTEGWHGGAGSGELIVDLDIYNYYVWW